MSISVSRESISKLMGELVETFPMEAEGRSSISDFGKLLFTEGQANAAKPGPVAANSANTANAAAKPATGSKRVFTEIKGVPRQKQHDIMKTKDKAVPKRWTQEEDDKLREAVGRHGERNWKSIAEEVPGRNHTQCLQRWTKVLAPGLVKGHWRPDEDELLKELVAEGRKNWGQVATRIPGRTSKQCRERWYNHLDPSIIRGEYSQDEDRMILDAQARLGNRWSAIAAMLPGRTEDAVKIRWKSLCRVRKGQGRRGQNDKGKMTPKGVMSMQQQMMQQGPGFDGGMVKSEEVSAFSMHPQQQGSQMVRLPNGQMVPASNMQGGHHGMMGGMGGNGMMYPSDMSGGGYDPTMAHYRKPPMQQHIVNNNYHPLPGGPIPANNSQDYPPDRRSNMMNMPPNNMPPPSQSQDGYRQDYRGPSSGYPPNVTGGMYSTGSSTPSGGMNSEQMYHGPPQINNYRSGGTMYDETHASPHQPQQMSHSPHQQMMSYNYDMPPAPSAAERMNGGAPTSHSMHQNNNSINNPAAAFAHRQQQPPQQHYVDRSEPIPHHMPQHQQRQHSSMPAHEHDHHNAEKEPEHHMKHPRPNRPHAEEDPRSGPETQPMQNPAAMFARSQGAKAASPANGNPVAAFMQMQHQQKRNDQPHAGHRMPQGDAGRRMPQGDAGHRMPHGDAGDRMPQGDAGHRMPHGDAGHRMPHGDAGRRMPQGDTGHRMPQGDAGHRMPQGGPQRPFNPAAAFAQRFQAGQKPPMPSSNAGSTKSNDDTADEEDDDNGKTNEPSLKRVKPRLSIDAARASAARRLRNSGSGGNLAGRGSLDVFLNEIGDVGRLSDLKMDEFQTLEELWRVSGDMDRLSL